MSIPVNSNDLTVSNVPEADTNNIPESTSEIKEIDTNKATSTPAEIPDKNFLTKICSSPQDCKSLVIRIFYFSLLAILLIIVVTHAGALANFSDGILKLFKYFVLYSMVFGIITLFIKLLGTLYWWVVLFYWCIERMIDPLKDNTVRSWYYYLTDYVNWIIYYPAMIYYFFFMIALFMILSLIILPFVAFIGFLIGYIFSMMGEDPCNKGFFSRMLSAVTGAVKTFVPGAASAAKKGEEAMKKATVIATEAKDKAVAAAQTAKSLVPDSVKKTVASKFGVSGVSMNPLDPTKMADSLKTGQGLLSKLPTADALKTGQGLLSKLPTADALKTGQGLLSKLPTDALKKPDSIVPSINTSFTSLLQKVPRKTML
jgi:hypothetical protein